MENLKKFEITFYLINGKEIGHLIEIENINTVEDAKNQIKFDLQGNPKGLDLAEDLVVYPQHITHFLVRERD